MRFGRLWVAFLACLTCALCAPLALAQSALNIDATPVLGANAPAIEGWSEVSVRLENTGAKAFNGYLELETEGRSYGMLSSPAAQRILSRAPFAVAPKGRVSLLMPGHGMLSRLGEVFVTAVDAHGTRLTSTRLASGSLLGPLLFDLSTPNRVAATLNGAKMPIRRRAYNSMLGPAALMVSMPQRNPVSGELCLPDLAAGYAGATVVLASGRTISTLPPVERDALFSWVLAGGALALTIDRPEDEQSAWLQALAGGHVHSTAATRQLKQAAQFAVPAGDPRSGESSAAPRFVLQSAQPSPALTATLSGLGGANLRPSPWGEAASYGLGEVHFLAFDPDTELAANDAWARLKVIDLVRHAWERADTVALPHGQLDLSESRIADVRRVLDPNESTHWTIVVSALLLLLYAALAGPLNFYLAKRKGRPLQALLYLPLYAAAALLSIMGLGFLGKGVTGRARHLTLIEAGAGMPRAAITRFRGLYASSAGDITVRAARGSVLDVVGDPAENTRDLLFDRDGLRLEKLRQKPWQVEVVREDGFSDLGAGISLTRDDSGALHLKNRCARDLLSVIVNTPGRGLVYFPKVADGQAVLVASGRPLGRVPAFSPSGALGSADTHPLASELFGPAVEEHTKGLSAAWSALSQQARDDVDWWPDDVPVLLAEIEGGEGKTQDSGLRLDVDRVLIRVVGYGGVP